MAVLIVIMKWPHAHRAPESVQTADGRIYTPAPDGKVAVHSEHSALFRQLGWER